MTVTSTTNRVSYAGDGVTTVFAFSFPITVSSDLKVMSRTAAAVEATLVLNTDYTVTGAPYTAGGAITLSAASTVGLTYFLIGNVPPTQSTVLQDGGPLPAGTVNASFDRRAMVERRMWEQVGRALVLRDTDTLGTGKFDGQSNEIINLDDGTAGSSAATVQQIAAAVALGAVGPAGSITAYQLRQALVDTANPSGINLVPNITNAVYEDMRDAASRQWFACRIMSPGDALATLVQSTASWSAGQMTTFLALAASKPV